MTSAEPTYILTAGLDADSFAWLDDLRRKHFPPERNILQAHLTLFHRLSSAQTARLADLDLPTAPLPVVFDRPVLLGFGVAIEVHSPDLEHLRTAAQNVMRGELSRQDSQAWRPHVTIQNKVTAEVALRLYGQMNNAFVRRAGTVTGLLVGEYLGGPWRAAERHHFTSA